MKKKIISVALVLSLGITSTASIHSVYAATDESKIIYVSDSGDYSNGDGTKENPYKTIDQARIAVRALPKDRGDIIVEVADGFYETETIHFDENDSGTQDCNIIYKAASGATPIISGGTRVTSHWEIATEVNWLASGLTAYKTPLIRNKKLRAIYVNGNRASMTSKTANPVEAVGSYKVVKGSADWAWIDTPSTATHYTGSIYSDSVGLLATTRNPQNIELESGSTWQKAKICVQSLQSTDAGVQVNFQMPYAAIAQNLAWSSYGVTKRNTIYNVYEWLKNAGEFYFDQENQMLYYIPLEGEDMSSVEVVIPKEETIIQIKGSEPTKKKVEYISFEGLTFAHTDWNLYEVGGSYGNAAVQACVVATAFADGNWHNDIYRSYDVPPAAIHVNSASHITIRNSQVTLTGYAGIHLENDVNDCDITGNKISHTGGSGVIIGHPQHVYENDTDLHQVTIDNVGPEKEKFPTGTEGIPHNIYIRNNYFYKNCYFFTGNAPLTTFYTKNMWVEHNFIYACSYSGMSIGWGWCEFDGNAAAKLPGIATTTSRNNHVNYNRIEEICSVLHDGGGIYTLGQQGNEDWTEHTEMNGNYINAYREKTVADRSRAVNGFHPDEGSAYIKFDSNVVTNIIQNVYELNNWKRKHDMAVTNAYSNTDSSVTTAPNCTLDMYVNEDYIWPKAGHDIVLHSGLEDEYVHLIEDEIIPDSYYELASNVCVMSQEELNRRGLLGAKDTVWLAPENTSDFVENDIMTKAAGNSKTIIAPKNAGQYKLYIVYENGQVSEPSEYTVYVGDVQSIANVKDNDHYNVSKIKPFVLELDTKLYSFALNGEPVDDGFQITQEGSYLLEGTPIDDSLDTFRATFTTSITDANKLLVDNITTGTKTTISLSVNLYDANKRIWLAPSGLTAFDESQPDQTMVSGNCETMIVPEKEGEYILTVTDLENNILSRSDAMVFVTNTPISKKDLYMWFDATKGLTVGENDKVLKWANQVNDSMILTSSDTSTAPTLTKKENGAAAISFDGTDDLLQYSGVDMNDKSNLSMIIVSKYEGEELTYNNSNGDRHSPFFIKESGSWGGMMLSPYQNFIVSRFGSGKSNCYIKYQRPEIVDNTTITIAVKEGSTEKLYVGNENVLTVTDQAEKTANIGNVLNVGMSVSGKDNCYYKGTISEILVYNRSLTQSDIDTIVEYMHEKHISMNEKQMLCDFNEDNKLTAVDALYLLQNMDNITIDHGDITGDGFVDTKDVLYVLEVASGEIEKK